MGRWISSFEIGDLNHNKRLIAAVKWATDSNSLLIFMFGQVINLIQSKILARVIIKKQLKSLICKL